MARGACHGDAGGQLLEKMASLYALVSRYSDTWSTWSGRAQLAACLVKPVYALSDSTSVNVVRALVNVLSYAYYSKATGVAVTI